MELVKNDAKNWSKPSSELVLVPAKCGVERVRVAKRAQELVRAKPDAASRRTRLAEREAEAREKRPNGEKKNNQHLFAALEQLVVAPAHRGRGLGGALCRAAAVAASEVLKVGGLVGYASRYDASLPAWYKQLDNAAVTSAEATAGQPVQMTARLTGEAVQRAKQAIYEYNKFF